MKTAHRKHSSAVAVGILLSNSMYTSCHKFAENDVFKTGFLRMFRTQFRYSYGAFKIRLPDEGQKKEMPLE